MRWEEIQHLKYLVSYLEGKHEDSAVWRRKGCPQTG
jgi:hypothetical protein